MLKLQKELATHTHQQLHCEICVTLHFNSLLRESAAPALERALGERGLTGQTCCHMDMLLSSGKGCAQHHTSTSGHNSSGLCTWGHMGIVPSDLDLWKTKRNGSDIGRFAYNLFLLLSL